MAKLPQPRTRFFGRRRALARVRGLLSEHRLVTLTGVGGSGKTRLALRLAEEAEPDLADEVWWVDLVPLDDPRLVTPTVCSSLEVRLTPGTRPLEALLHRLRSSRALLALDNCEHLVDACADLVAVLLERCLELRVLATSREALGVPGEVAWPVPSLSVPGEDVGHDRQIDRAAEAASVQLFVDRARAVRPDFELTPSNVSAVVGVCGRLDGIPLALELAAGLVRVLAVEQIAERLEEGLGLLRQTGRRVPPRHRTMRAALDWSHALLPEAERVLFRRLGAFVGHPSIEACEAVCAGGTLSSSTIVELLARLIDKSLIVVDDRGGSARYRLLEPVRQFAVDRLEDSDELEELRRRHAAYYLEIARTAAPDLRGGGRAAALDRLESEHDNLRRAWDQAVEAGDGRTVAGLARALFWFWNFGGHFDEGRTRSEEALERLAPGSGASADLLYTSGTFAWMQGDCETAQDRLEACAAACRGGGHGDLLSLALRELAGVRLTLGDLTAAAELYEESITRLRESGRTWDLALALVVLGDVRQGLGEAATARELRDEGRVLFGRVGDPWGISLALFGLGVGAARAGDLDAARVHGREALTLQRGRGDDWNIGQILALLGEIEDRAGHPERAAELLLDSIETIEKVGDRITLVHGIASLAEVERQRGRTFRAVRLAGAADALGEMLEGSYPYALATEDERARTVKALRRAAGEEAFAEEWARGRSMRLEEAVAFAADGTGPRRVELPGVEEDGGAATLHVFALGPPEVYRSRRRLRAADWTFALPKELLFYLLLHGPRTKEQIGLDFWPEASTDQLRGRFRTTLYHLRRALGGKEWVRYENGRYTFNRELDCWFDVEAFESNLDRAAGEMEPDTGAAARHLERAVELYRGDFLEGESPGRWADEHAGRLSRRYLDAVLTLAGLRASEGLHDLAADLYRRALDRDDLDERAHRGLVRSLARAGDRTAALRQLETLERLLRRELDAEPSPETLELRSRLERGDSRLERGDGA